MSLSLAYSRCICGFDGSNATTYYFGSNAIGDVITLMSDPGFYRLLYVLLDGYNEHQWAR